MKVVVVGGGKVGTHLATMLLAAGHKVRVIEVREEEISHLRRALPPEALFPGNGADPVVMEAASMRQADVVAAVTGADETNLVVAGLARLEFGVPRVIARVNNPRNAWMFTPEMSVDVAVNQADLMAHLIAEEMSLGNMMTLLKLRKGQYSLIEEKIDPTASVAGKALSDVILPDACVITAIIRKGQLNLPHQGFVLQPGDEVLALVHASQAPHLAALLGKAGGSRSLERPAPLSSPERSAHGR